ncbi:MAG: ECF transporter S component [Clostridiales bacterium]|nr:ECF transporter S component [Clostridiales bacterium]
MQKMSAVKKSIITAVCIALCVVLPQAFHAVPNAGAIYLPMHIPVLLCGLICGWSYGLLCGLAGPALSALLTGMPPAAVLPGMMVECGVYGLAAGLLMQLVRTKHLYADLYISLAAAMLLGRVVSGIAKALIFSAGSYSMASWVAGSFVTALPGIVIQLALLPSIVYALMRARLIPQRYPKDEE